MDDADESSIHTRISTFLEKTVPVIEAYKTNGKVIEVDGEGSVEEVYKRLLQALEFEH